MATNITDAELQTMLSEGLSQNEIARRTGIPRTTLRKRLKTFGTPQADEGVSKLGTPNVYKGTQSSKKADKDRDDLQEILAWWKARKRALQIAADTVQQTQRQTYHVQKRYIEAIKRAAELEGVSIMDIVNRAFKQFFRDEV